MRIKKVKSEYMFISYQTLMLYKKERVFRNFEEYKR